MAVAKSWLVRLVQGHQVLGHDTGQSRQTRVDVALRAKTRWRTAAAAASLPEAVPENEEVVPVNAVSTWVLPSGVTVGR